MEGKELYTSLNAYLEGWQVEKPSEKIQEMYEGRKGVKEVGKKREEGGKKGRKVRSD